MISVLQKWSILLLLGVWVGGMLAVKRPLPVHAQSGCALRINEIMYHPAAGTGSAARAEWVELYVSADITSDTTFYISDQDTPVADKFEKVFVVPAGTTVDTYIVIHNDGDPANDGNVSANGIYTTMSFFMGNGIVNLNNTGDDIVLYQGGDIDGNPCDYVEYLVPNSTIPAGFTWNNGSCSNPSSAQAFGTSISLDPDGSLSNNACDWTESGLNSPNDPGTPITGSPDTQGYNNTTTPTAVTLASFKTADNQPGMVAAGYVVVMMSLLTGRLWQIKKKD